ncbi:MAG: hypothetical protein SWX82_08185 [Cyanobacteriota bacterium]|nr:hypothetical protein [Cyanobacteriota bacterium]
MPNNSNSSDGQKLLSWLYPSLIFAIDQELVDNTAPDVDKLVAEV